ncbi:hypothetical protein ACFP1Z_27540 [Streptomyces gamaensis]|uniref:Serine/arginine repetitive matrix protein 2 n=1 Tax=Streptomyces gamaensis TaxID=1763542 RepID=A0ABW0ZA14_9ACTN
MTRWDPDLQQWVEDDRSRDPVADAPPQADDDPDVVLLAEPSDEDGPTGPSHATILAGAVAGVVLLGGLGFGGWALFGDSGDSGDGGGGGQPPGVSAGPSPGPATTGPGATSGITGGWPYYTPPSTTPPSTTPPSTTPPSTTVPNTMTGVPTPPPGAPAGFRRAADAAGFRLDVPVTWARTQQGASVFYKNADGSSLIQVYTLDGAATTPYQSLAETERNVSRNPGYRRLALGPVVPQAGEAGQGAGGAAELEYLYTRDDGTTRRVVDRAFTGGDGRQYALLVAGPAADWATHLGVYRVALRSFCVGGTCVG